MLAVVTLLAASEAFYTMPLKKRELPDRTTMERSLRLGDELGGHIVAGHVDAVAEVLEARPENASVRWRFRVPGGLARESRPSPAIASNIYFC